MPDQESSPSLASVLVMLLCVAIGIVLLIPATGAARRSSNQMKNSANLRGIDQSMVIFGTSNNDFLPGFDAKGNLIPASQTTTGSTTYTGAAFSSRLWILLNGQYIGGDLIMNPLDIADKWVSGRGCTTANFSYAGLQIGDTAFSTATIHQEGRAAEWKNNANSQAIMMGDRNQGSSNADANVQTGWWTVNHYMFGLLTTHTRQKGVWQGNLVWGDNHAEFQQTHKGFTTRYLATTNTNDNLFATTSATGVTETSLAPDSNAMLIYF